MANLIFLARAFIQIYIIILFLNSLLFLGKLILNTTIFL